MVFIHKKLWCFYSNLAGTTTLYTCTCLFQRHVCTDFQKSFREKDNVPLKLSSLFINDREIKQITSIKYLVGLIDEQLTWKERITVTENKVSKNLGLLYRTRKVLDSTTLKNLYFSFIHGYLNYGNIVWDSTSTTKLKKTSQ